MGGRRPVTVLLADDSPGVRRRLRDQLAAVDGLELVGVAASGPEALEMAERHTPAVAVVDLVMPGVRGTALVSDIVTRSPGTKVVVVTLHDAPVYRTRCLEAGASHFLSKRTELERVPEVVRELGLGDSWPGEP